MITHHKKGFTLVELIIVISIIAVLASLAFMALSGETAQARDSKRAADLKVFEDAIATSNGKNKPVSFKETGDVNRSVAIGTNVGSVFPIRGAWLKKIDNTIFDSDVLPTAPRDPKGSPYLAAFLSKTEYQLIGTQENPDTKTETAIVRGTFKEGAIIDVLLDDITASEFDISVPNPQRFVKGDIITIDSEDMEVLSFNTVNGTVKVANDGADRTPVSGNAKVHNKGASIKLKTSVPGASSLTCLGSVYESDAANGSAVGGELDGTTNTWNDFMVGTAAKGIVCGNSDMTVSGNTRSNILNEKTTVPYTVNTVE